MRTINSIGRNIFKAIHEGKWLYIEYKNKSDTISNEILLSYHYRCNKAIIDFSNKKYYNNKLKIKTVSPRTIANTTTFNTTLYFFLNTYVAP